MAATTLTLASAHTLPPRMWLDGLRRTLLTLRTDLQDHGAATGGPLGAYQRVLGTSPRLSKAIADLDRDREGIARLVDRALARVAETSSVTRVDQLRVDGFALIQRLTRYQQHDADLLHEADQVDVGGQG